MGALTERTRVLTGEPGIGFYVGPRCAWRERHELALQLLRAPELSLDEVASRLCYSNATSFARAFRRWTGDAPARYRARQPMHT